ncbi:tRNA-i(6)A37 thiotransferase enzyme MiaB [Candidatus Arthromitus sp. SFB-mouse-Japan]|uniref:tRNA (N6-isopentenyl adenosine(37)-C2)-methylthiotransferase MiaB n=2 Tax=Candidatus Neoarthromitus TaxID=49082 RepID=UPI00021B7CAA|nr:tRNA (N6-isopentenyl adenosine(37)-C2)-methylthiotransferase MiaB [Candidatus Arthromitus sp. SFB-mouse]EIA23875.1 (Dimethylallyl)adenosine tRNA methylthiotransferase miaB [Candidatus Arthromitus sp. SFB-2]EIA27478.1 (Dimethylallyl)adenosine tRNA methylthiotransferase miaB [Candidatus Arthromitus sp. SFB-co]EIA30809.1 (Dimethylallyl)adenosine tRNA methylthiotransferase miaB [Candidatus Arthromitus sp. SFB-mouse-SU]BAK56525.1 tRNA-i(6)A37 thiotransferase enzyme MiaB [Candidatus Arthromitus sp
MNFLQTNKKDKLYFIETWGCQMNEEDSEKLSGMLISMGYSSCENRNDADIIIFNTCCVRENAELKVHGNLGQLKGLKKSKKDLIIAVCGCMMQQKGIPQEISKKYPFVDIIFGTHNLHKFPEYLNRVLMNDERILEIEAGSDEIIEGLTIDRKSSLKAFVTIMYGCDNFCTYCIVPQVRGREKSRKSEDIINEIRELAKDGYKEITLLGQNVNSYGKGLEEDIDFPKLLKKVNEVDGIERIRYMTSHPKDFSDDLIEVMKNCDKVCSQLHLPVQSGSNRILRVMNRHYKKEEYLDKIKKIKSLIPDLAITTDIIVGFPGETEEDFEETLDLVREVRYDSAFMFLYSNRKFTGADMMPNQIPDEVKHKRFNRLVETVNQICAEINKTYEGKIVKVLVEGNSKNDETKLSGRTDNGKLVNFIGDKNSIGKIVDVKITNPKSFSLEGEQI